MDEYPCVACGRCQVHTVQTSAALPEISPYRFTPLPQELTQALLHCKQVPASPQCQINLRLGRPATLSVKPEPFTLSTQPHTPTLFHTSGT